MNIQLLKNKKSGQFSGFTLAETLISLAVLLAISMLIGSLARDIFSFNGYISADLNAQIAGRRAIVVMTKEMREMSPSSLGTFALSQAATSSVTFYSNIDSDALKEQVRYYMQGKSLMRSVIKPSGSPLTYNSGSAVVTTVISSVANSTSTPIFEYYGSTYAGSGNALAMPVTLSNVKFIRVNVFLERRSSRANTPLNITSGTSLRNLKENI